MFKTIKWKTTVVFSLSVVTILTVVCAFQLLAMTNSFRKEFSQTINSVFTDDFIAQVEQQGAQAAYTVNPAEGDGLVVNQEIFNNAQAVFDLVNDHSGVLGLNQNRFLCVLDQAGNVMYTTDPETLSGIEKTQGVVQALTGQSYLGGKLFGRSLEYSFPFSTPKGVYVLYIKDTKLGLHNALLDALLVYLYALALALILCLFAGLRLAKSVTLPIKKLNNCAKKLAEGDREALSAVAQSGDELGELASTLVSMAHSLDASAVEMQNEKTKLETILQNMTDGILAFNLQGRLIHINPEAQRLLNRKYLDDTVFDRFFKEINANITMGDLLYMPSDTSVERQVTINKDRVMRMNFATFKLDNKVGGIVVVLHDITKQEKLEQSRRDFVADVSHELRTPLTTIKSYAETLTDNPDADRELQTRFLDVIASEADRMARIIGDLLTLSELDGKHADFRPPEPFDIRKLLEGVVERMAMTAKKKNQTLTYRPINDVPLIEGDRDGLERIIINIVSNALKYTPSGGIIDVFSSKVYNDICIKVTDNGIGIPAENLPNIFERFYRVDKARSRDTGGTGLGLAIAKQTIESAFDGKIKITSEVNKGTEVIITIPVPSGK